MSTSAVLGLQWGDEGKGKLVTGLAAAHDIVVRYQGGGNAGHTVYVDGKKLVLHHLPCGAVARNALCLLMQGMVLEPNTFLKEIESVRALGIEVEGRIKVSERLHIVCDFHKALDLMRESEASGGLKIGTTGRGIGNAYADKAMRFGIRAGDLLDSESLRELLTASLAVKNRQLEAHGKPTFDVEEQHKVLTELGKKLEPYLCDTSMLLAEALDAGKNVLFEGAQAAMLDIEVGTYPYVTSSHTTICGINSGSGVNVGTINEGIGVVKAYCTRVGLGGFPTEIHGAEGDAIRDAGGEYGSTTGRPRRCGWFDAHLVRASVKLGRINALCMTKMDVLRGLKTLKVGVGYEGWDSAGYPASHRIFDALKPKYVELPGFEDDILGATDWDALPKTVKEYVGVIEDTCGVRIKYFSTGPETHQMIVRG